MNLQSVKLLLDETKQCMCCLQMHDDFFWAGWGHVEKIRFRRDRKGLQILFLFPLRKKNLKANMVKC